jgi:acetyl esterase/lipase
VSRSRSGDKAFFAPTEEAFAPVGRKLAAAGVAVFSVNYRFAPFPAALVDVSAAVRWLRARAARFGIDPSRIGEPSTCAARYRGASPGSFVDSSDPPMLIVNGSDEVVPLAQAQELARRFGQAQVAHTLIIVKGRPHAAQYSAQALGPTIRFLIRYLGRSR